MIILGSMRDVARMKTECDVVFAIVRSYKKPIESVTQCAVLSPSYKLFTQYLQWKKDGVWGNEAFKIYKRQFLKEMQSEEAKKALNMLWKGSERKGYKIGLVCYCSDRHLCHRTIVGELLADAGCEVIFE